MEGISIMKSVINLERQEWPQFLNSELCDFLGNMLQGWLTTRSTTRLGHAG